ncbi:signal peptidase I [Cellulomonas sp.]|uniref:signal peptidase I n=1 Tax=Cellulomonas sp. TaxID=40001 RepID=UPI003BA8A88B
MRNAMTAAARSGRTSDEDRLGVVRVLTGMISGMALAAAVLVALVLIVVPLALGATPYTVLTGSMRPSMPPGTLVVSRPVPADEIHLGDVVTYQLVSNEPGVVTHRVVGVGSTAEGERQLLTRGDANNVDDEPVRAVQVRGVVVYSVPFLGYLNTWVGVNRPGWLLKAVAGALILYGLALVGAGVRERFRRARVPERTADVLAPAPTVVSAAPARAVPVPVVLGVAVCLLVVGAVVVGGRRSR